jgi:hypothetical protein
VVQELGTRFAVLLDTALALELEGGMGDPEAGPNGRPQAIAHHLGLLERGVTGEHEMGRQGPHLRREAPDVQIVHSVDAVHGCHRR